jgi:hypothetical protein
MNLRLSFIAATKKRSAAGFSLHYTQWDWRQSNRPPSRQDLLPREQSRDVACFSIAAALRVPAGCV